MSSEDIGVVADALGEALGELTEEDALRYMAIACRVLRKMIPMVPMQYQWIGLLAMFGLMIAIEVIEEDRRGRSENN